MSNPLDQAIIESLCKTASEEELWNNWNMLDLQEIVWVWTEELLYGKSLRNGEMGISKCNLFTKEKHKQEIIDLWHRLCKDTKKKEHELYYNLHRRNSLPGRGYDIYHGSFCADDEEFECELVISHYLNVISDEDLGKGLPVPAVVEHDFIARLIDKFPTYRPAKMPLYVGNLYDFSKRVLKRAFAIHRKQLIADVSNKFNF